MRPNRSIWEECCWAERLAFVASLLMIGGIALLPAIADALH